MKKTMIKFLREYPIISAVKDNKGLRKSLASDSRVVFILYGNICNIKDIIDKVKSVNKIAIVHIDLISGLSNSEISIEYLYRNTSLDGIISTKYNLLKAAREKGLITIQRIFLIDSMSLSNLENIIKRDRVDFIEVLPGVIPKVINKAVQDAKTPIIAGGLVYDKEDAKASLEAGAIAISTSSEILW